MSRRFFSATPEFGLTRYFHYNEADDTFAIETVQDVEPLLEANLQERNGYTSLDRWRDGMGTKVASMPMVEYARLAVAGKLEDQAFMRRWLNDSENRKYRTRLGKV